MNYRIAAPALHADFYSKDPAAAQRHQDWLSDRMAELNNELGLRLSADDTVSSARRTVANRG